MQWFLIIFTKRKNSLFLFFSLEQSLQFRASATEARVPSISLARDPALELFSPCCEFVFEGGFHRDMQCFITGRDRSLLVANITILNLQMIKHERTVTWVQKNWWTPRIATAVAVWSVPKRTGGTVTRENSNLRPGSVLMLAKIRLRGTKSSQAGEPDRTGLGGEGSGAANASLVVAANTHYQHW